MNSTLRPSADGNTWGVDCNFFEPFDILSPEILLRDEGLGTAGPPNNNHIMDYNYVYIERPVDRYYFINKWAVRTDEELKGRGIKFFEKSATGKNIYYCTDNAFNRLCERMDIDQEILLD